MIYTHTYIDSYICVRTCVWYLTIIDSPVIVFFGQEKCGFISWLWCRLWSRPWLSMSTTFHLLMSWLASTFPFYRKWIQTLWANMLYCWILFNIPKKKKKGKHNYNQYPHINFQKRRRVFWESVFEAVDSCWAVGDGDMAGLCFSQARQGEIHS